MFPANPEKDPPRKQFKQRAPSLNTGYPARIDGKPERISGKSDTPLF
jgi:hypothetical protein